MSVMGWWRSRSGVPGVLVVLLTAAMMVGSMLLVPSPATGAVPAYCSLTWPGQVRFVWDGSAGDGRWSTPSNWSNNLEPSMLYADNGYVCIPQGAVVTLAAGERGDVQAVDLQSGATLVMQTGSKLYGYGDQATRPSVIRGGAGVTMSGALGGPGRIDLLGQLRWRSTASGASTIATRDCALGATCTEPVSGPVGHLEVNNSGLLLIDGRGVNLADQYRIVVRGQARLAGQGYIAADRGTAFELQPKIGATGVGVFQIGNDGGYYEGRTLLGFTALSRFVNAGRLVKTAGAGTSVISATYSVVGAGQLQVNAGTLLLPDGVTKTAQVAAGRSYGTGTCADFGVYACQPVTEPGVDLQNATFQVPASDTNGARIQVTEVAGGPAGRIGSTVQLHNTGLAATPGAPAVFTLRYDSSILGGRGWSQVEILRRADGATAFLPVPACTSQGTPPTGQVACVDRRGLPGSSRDELDQGDPPGAPVDAVMVVRTTGTSRWVGR